MILSKAITLAESSRPQDQILADELISAVMNRTGKSIRIGITGVPGVGKSTFIEAFGNVIVESGRSLAVLTIDPTSQLTRGSILGDKTRMQSLSKNPKAYIRPTASGNMLGGTAARTREAMLLCEAAGFDTIIVETVGVGQSEIAVRSMVDFFLLLMLAGAGDELQGIKKGIMEMADAIAVTKADGDNVKHASEAQAEYQHALHLMPGKNSGWTPPVVTCSAIENKGLTEIWNLISKYEMKTTESSFFSANRSKQNVKWFLEHFQFLLLNDFRNYPELKSKILDLEREVTEESISPYAAAAELLKAYQNIQRNSKS